VTLTIYGEIAQRSRSGALDFDIRALQEEEYGLKGRTVDRPYIYSPSVSLPSFLTARVVKPAPRSVISANVKLALLCRSIF